MICNTAMLGVACRSRFLRQAFTLSCTT